MNNDISKLSNDKLQDSFTEAFDPIASYNNISSYECICKRDMGSKKATMEVTIIGMAGSPNIDEFKNGKVEKAKEIDVSVDGKEQLKFKLMPKETVSLNTNDYMVVYNMM